MITHYRTSIIKFFKSQVARNWSLLFVSNIACRLLGILATAKVARALEPEGYGLFYLIQTIATLGTIIAGFGIRRILIRECARHPGTSSGLFSSGLVINFLLLLPVGIGIVIYCYTNMQELSLFFSAIAIGIVAGRLIWELMESVAFGNERMEFSAGIDFFGAVIWVTFVWFIPNSLLSPLSVSLAFMVLQGLKTLIYALFGYRAGLIKYHMQLSNYNYLLRESFPFYWLALLTAASFQLPIFFLATRADLSEVGLFNAGYRLINPMQMLLTTLMLALYPGLSRAGVNNIDHFKIVVKHALTGLVLFGTILAVSVSMFRREIILIIFGELYLSAADTLAFQCWHVLFMAVFGLIGMSLAAKDKQSMSAILSTFYALIAVPILWFGAASGAKGLAMAMLLSAVINMSYHWIIFQKCFPAPYPLSFSLYLFITIATGMFIAWGVPAELFWPIRGALNAILIALIVICFITVLPIKSLVKREIDIRSM